MAFPAMIPMVALTNTANDIPALVKKADELLSPASLINLSVLVGTNGQLILRNDQMVLVVAEGWTNSGPSFQRPPSRFAASAAIEELRRLTNLPLTTLASLLGVERRSVYFWIEGRPISSDNQTRLETLQSLSRRLDRGEPSETAEAVLAACQVPETPSALPDKSSGLRAIEGQPGARLPQFSVAALIQRGDDTLPRRSR
jgi:hypothetical protein